jgi:hypothetical protein
VLKRVASMSWYDELEHDVARREDDVSKVVDW